MKREFIWKLTDVEFIKIWQGSRSLDEVAEKIGLNKLQCSGKAYKLRSKGVRLQRFKRGFCESTMNIEELNSLIEETISHDE